MKQRKIALVTGGSRGLGRDMAMSLAKKGLDVIFTYHSNMNEAQNVRAEIEEIGINAAILQLDTSNYDEYEPFFEIKLKKVLKNRFNTNKFDFLINNAGFGVFKSFESTSLNQFKDMVHVHLMAAFFFTQKGLQYMNDGGGVINISSGLTRFTMPGYSIYAAIKGAVEVLSKYQALELGTRMIRVNTLAPGAIETDFGGGAVRDNPQLNKHIAAETALGRVGVPQDIGPVVAFLCSEDANWINGQRIEVSGGVNL